jgi:uncharacterized protein (DUF305 family)
MMRRLLAVGAAALTALMLLTACSNTSTSTESSTPAQSSSPAQPHNSADVMFAQQMIPHHQQAIQMSDTVLGKQGIDPRVVNLAKAIKAAQGPELQQMQGWLSAWGEPTTMAMPGHDMTGMMSDQDMAALQNAQGVEASKLFLTQMISHHQGAITMANDEIKTGQYPPAIAMARSIATSQQKEIDEMQGIRASL